MNVSVKDAGTCRKTLHIEIPVNVINDEHKETLKLYTKFANLPGFRKGKAPAHLIEKKYAKEINQEMEERILPKFYQQAREESGLKIVNVIDVSEAKLVLDQPLVFDVTVDIEPEFKLPKYVEIPLKETKEAVTDEQVQEQIESIRSQHATFEDSNDKTVAAGDMAQLSYTATADGKPLIEVAPEAKGIGEGSGYWISADGNSFLPGMGEAIVNLKNGDKKDVEITFPAEFFIKELAGLKTIYSIEITGVRTRVLPELNEALFKEMHVESEDELRNQIRDYLERGAESKALNNKYEQVVEYLVKKTKFDLPESVLQQQTHDMIYDIARHRMMMGVTQEQLAEQHEEIKKEAEDRALENVKLRYIGLAIATEQGFEATQNEINEELASMAVRQRKDVRALRKEMEENKSLGSVSDQVRFNKALDYLIENAKIK